MSLLETAVQHALASPNNANMNKAYLEFMKANFVIPVEKSALEEEPKVLFSYDNGLAVLPVFTERHYLDAWAVDIADRIAILELTAVDLLRGIGEQVSVALNVGSASYKAFCPAEIERMRGMVMKLYATKSST